MDNGIGVDNGIGIWQMRKAGLMGKAASSKYFLDHTFRISLSCLFCFGTSHQMKLKAGYLKVAFIYVSAERSLTV